MLMQEATVETALDPTVKARLQEELHAYYATKAERDGCEARLNHIRATIDVLREATGQAQLDVDGVKLSLVAPVRRTLDVKKLVTAGVTMDLINMCYKETATKPYTKITAPGERSTE
jgi:hypothetical protein